MVIPVATITYTANYLVAYVAQAANDAVTTYNYILCRSVFTINPIQQQARRRDAVSDNQLYAALLAQLANDIDTDITSFAYDITTTNPSAAEIRLFRATPGNTILVFNALLSSSEYTVVESDDLRQPLLQPIFNTTTFYFTQVIRIRITVPAYYAALVQYSTAYVGGPVSASPPTPSLPQAKAYSDISAAIALAPSFFKSYHVAYYNPSASSSTHISTDTVILISAISISLLAVISIIVFVVLYRRRHAKSYKTVKAP
jgi:hypothetical protein